MGRPPSFIEAFLTVKLSANYGFVFWLVAKPRISHCFGYHRADCTANRETTLPAQSTRSLVNFPTPPVPLLNAPVPASPVTVMLVEEQTLLRQFLVELVNGIGGYTVVGSTDNRAAA